MPATDGWDYEGGEVEGLPPLERACFFASWCCVGKFRRVSKSWVDYALALAVSLRGHAHVPRARS